MNKEELNILKTALLLADQYFTGYCEFVDTNILTQEEIDEMDDEIEQERAQELFDYNKILGQAHAIIEKYNKK